MHKPLHNSIDFTIHPTFAIPADVDTVYRRAEALANMGRYFESLIHFDVVLAQQPDRHEAWTFRGVILIHLGQNQEALESCDRALAIRPESMEAWTFRGVALQRLRQYRKAYASYDRALGIDRSILWHEQFLWKRQLKRFLGWWPLRSR
jgi:tetratricopeptide (TPR) repeat protein